MRGIRTRSNRLPGRVALSAIALAGCNTFTGVSDLKIGDEAGDPSGLAPADGVVITRLDLYQGIRRPLMDAGVPADNTIPIVRERESFLRIFYQLAGPPVTDLTARITIGDGEPIVIPAAASLVSNDLDLTSTINVTLPPEAVTGPDYRVELLQKAEVTSGDNAGATFPTDGERAPLPVQSAGPLRLVVVPVRYDADGSGRLPDTSEAQLAIIQQAFYTVFPVPDVEVRVTDPMPSNVAVSGGSVDAWSVLLDEVTEFRAASGAAPDEYYLGLFVAADTFGEFCAGGCITGLSHLAEGPGDAFFRASIAVGFPGEESASTAVHEVGHAHGRRHAPSGGAANVDPAFPHPDGVTGVWGYDLVTGELHDPTRFDFMGYADPTWVSDYTFEGLFERSQLVNASFDVAGIPVVYDRILVLPSGAAAWRGQVTLDQPLGGRLTRIELDEGEVEGRFFPFDHLAGGTLLVPASEARRARFSIGGRSHLAERP